jgi:hypothetical protein
MGISPAGRNGSTVSSRGPWTIQDSKTRVSLRRRRPPSSRRSKKKRRDTGWGTRSQPEKRALQKVPRRPGTGWLGAEWVLKAMAGQVVWVTRAVKVG